MWVAGVGARMAFAFAATHGAGPAIGRFSVAHHITGSGAWVAALVMMALNRRADPAGRGLPARPPAGRSAGRRPGAHPGRYPCLISYPGLIHWHQIVAAADLDELDTAMGYPMRWAGFGSAPGPLHSLS